MEKTFFDESYFDKMDERYLSETDLLFRDAVRKFIKEKIFSRVAGWEIGN
ncbi:MAG: hypothetical protein AAB851_03815 [Patescibacteria group bacterium]